MLVGVGTAGHHHGEILQGAVWVDGDVVGCLVTMPVGGIGSRVRYVAGVDGLAERAAAASGTSVVLGREAVGPGLDVVPAWKSKAGRAGGLALAAIGAPVVGRLEIECSLATGVGLGSSTCDVVAAIRAVCVAHGVELDAGRVARLAIEAEGAADPIMFGGEMVLFAQRRGRVLESFGAWTPRYAVLSIDTDLNGGGVDTLSLPMPQYTEGDLAAFESLIGRAREAFRRRDSVALAGIATESAALNQRYLPMRGFQEIRELAASYGALGVQISHSGTVAGVLFDARYGGGDNSGLGGASVEEVAAKVRSLGLHARGLFVTGAED